MKKTLATILMAAAMAPLAMADNDKAAELNIVENYEAAQANVPKDGYVVVLYADGWDKYSEKLAKQFLKNKQIKKAFADSVLIEMPVANLSTEETNKARGAKLGKLRWEGPHTYPAFALYDKSGRYYTTICIPYEDRKAFSKIANLIEEAHKAVDEQNALLEKAKGETGLARALTLGKAASFKNIRRPDNIVKMIKECDKDDKSGYIRSLEFNMYGYAEGTAKKAAETGEWKPILKEIEDKIADKAYNDEQRQGLYAMAIGLLHRHGTMAEQKKLVKYIRSMKSIDPDSILGVSAEHAQTIWARQLSYADGWSPAVLPLDETPTELAGPLPIKGAGTYEVTFTYSSGSHQLVVLGVQLFDGNKKVAEDMHRGTTGIKHNNNVYTLEVGAKVKDPHLKVIFDMKKDRQSNGTIKIEKK
ncbi:MAG: hypothetical protein IJA63_04425 [Akkermansia sp.]|nr:hypothetical protein [Akkermansia sp.]